MAAMGTVCSPSFTCREGWLLFSDFTTSEVRLWVVLRSDGSILLLRTPWAPVVWKEIKIERGTPITLQQPADAAGSSIVVADGPRFSSVDRFLRSRDVRSWHDAMAAVRADCPEIPTTLVSSSPSSSSCSSDVYTPPRQDSFETKLLAPPVGKRPRKGVARSLFPRAAPPAASAPESDSQRRSQAQYLANLDQIVGALC
jgi:rRNA maturation protein Nop10